MLNVLLESKAEEPRRAGGTIASTLAHAALIVGAITLTTSNGGATLAPPDDFHERPPVFVTPTPRSPQTEVSGPTTAPQTAKPLRRLPTIDHVPDVVSPPDVDLTVR